MLEKSDVVKIPLILVTLGSVAAVGIIVIAFVLGKIIKDRNFRNTLREIESTLPPEMREV